MGAWGHKTFENDDAFDFMADIEDSTDFSLIQETIERIIEEDAYLEASDCSMALTAIEIVGAVKKNDSTRFPEEYKGIIQNLEKPSKTVIEQSILCIDKILEESELKELWKENEELFSEWLKNINELKVLLS